MTETIKESMQHYVENHGEDKVYRRSVIETLLVTIPERPYSDCCPRLKALRGFYKVLCLLESYVICLFPTSQALWGRGICCRSLE